MEYGCPGGKLWVEDLMGYFQVEARRMEYAMPLDEELNGNIWIEEVRVVARKARDGSALG